MARRRSGINGASMREAARNIEIVVEAGAEGAQVGLHTVGIEATNLIRMLVTGPSPSMPGSPPGLIFGGLRLSYAYEVSDGRLLIGSDASVRRPITGEQVDYAKYLEEGTSDMAPRPHLRPAMAAVSPLIGQIMARSITAAERTAAASLRGITLD